MNFICFIPFLASMFSGCAGETITSAPTFKGTAESVIIQHDSDWSASVWERKQSNSKTRLDTADITIDINMGVAIEADILADSTTYPILDPDDASAVYDMLEDIKDQLLASGELQYIDDFAWKIHVIDDDSVVNAFATAGGYTYVYTGLLLHLENEAEIAGVIAHEFAHADTRHSVQLLGKDLIEKLLSRRGQSQGRLLNAFLDAQYSQTMETQADTLAVRYLCDTDWDAAAFASFFANENHGNTKTVADYFSTHPVDEDRVENITSTATEFGCTGTQLNASKYQAIVAEL